MHAVPIQIDAAKMTERAEQDQVTRVSAEKETDAVVIPPATVSEQDGCTKPYAEELMRFMVRMCRDQISCNKNFGHVWPRWTKTWSMLEISKLVHFERQAGC